MSEWFEEWFNTDEYLYVYRHRNNEDAKNLFNLILKNVEIDAGSNVLDLACGAGRHSILFAKYGFNVTAVDLSENLLNVARNSAEELMLNIKFVKSDLRMLKLSDRFHLILNLFTSFGYFEADDENESVVKSVAEHLFDNSYFVIDYFNNVHLKKNLIPVSYDKVEEAIIKQERIFDKNRVVKKITVNKKNVQRTYFESVRAYSVSELTKMITANGLKISKVFGDYLGNAFDENNSSRIIIIAQK
jgi:SAM-dependent methyltransferase